MLEVLHPARTRFEFVLGNPEIFRHLFSFGSYQRVRERGSVRRRERRQPVDELSLDFGEFGWSTKRGKSRRPWRVTTSLPMFSDLQLFIFRDVHPFLLVF